MNPFYLLLALAMTLQACSSQSTEPSNEPLENTQQDAPATPTEQTPEWQSPPTGCAAPLNIPQDPLEVAPGNTGGVSNGNRRHLVNLEVDTTRNLAFACGTPGLEVYDIGTNPPTLLDEARGKLEHLAVLDDSYLAGTSKGRAGRQSESLRGQGLYVFDIGAGGSITEVSYSQFDDASGLAFDSPYLYMASYDGKFRVFDMSIPAQPELVGETDGLGNPWEIVVVQERAYVADNSVGIITMDISNPYSPRHVSAVPARGGVQDLVHANEHLYAAIGSAGIEIFSLSQPDTPASMSTLSLGGAIISVSVSGNHLWTTDQQSVSVTDISNPEAPVQLAVEDTPSWAMHVEANSEGALVADWQRLAPYSFDENSVAPEADPSKSALYFLGDADFGSLTVTNRGGVNLEIAGMEIDDPRFSLSIDRVSIAPGHKVSIELQFENDGEPLDSSLCIATNDPDEPIQRVGLSSSSTGTSVLIGETAPNFNLPDLDGNYLELAQQLGKPVVLSYFATW